MSSMLVACWGELSCLQLSDLESFIEVTERSSRSGLAELKEWFTSQTDGMDEEQAAEFSDFYYDDIALQRDVVPRYLRYSQVLLIYGVFEHQVGDLCRILHRVGATSKAPPKKLYIQDAKGFLTKHSKFRKAAFDDSWAYIDSARRLRNVIAHTNGRLGSSESDRKAEQVAKKLDGASIENRHIVVGEKFCSDMLGNAQDAITRLAAEAARRFD